MDPKHGAESPEVDILRTIAAEVPGIVFMVDREAYDAQTEMVALFRFFLEPLGVPVNRWSMSVNTTATAAVAARTSSRTYTFADAFALYYIPQMKRMLGDVELSDSAGTDPKRGSLKSCAELAADSKDWFTHWP
jgi:hypothetical protein